MQRLQVEASVLICLVLSTLGPCEAGRLTVVRVDDQLAEDSESMAAVAGKASCPQGLELEPGSVVCRYPDETGRASGIFTNFSKAKLLFNGTAGGAYLTSAQFLAELASAFTDTRAMYEVGASLATGEMKRNATFAELVSRQTAHKHSGLHRLEENLKPGFFVVEHAVEHGVVEGLEVGFHALAHAAEHGAVFGETFLASAFGLELAEVAAGASVVAAFVLEWVFPVLLPIQTALLIWQVRSHFKEQTHRAKNFTSHLVLKSDCMISRLQEGASSVKLLPIVGEVCGSQFEADLRGQVHAASRAKAELYATLAAVGRCLWPHGDRSWSKINCAETLYYKLLQSKGQAGILYGALAFMAYYGFRLDELTEKPFFEEWYELEFGIRKEATAVSLVPKLVEMKDRAIGEKWPVCMEMIAAHRAFERTFQRLNSAIQVWMRSFARGLRGVSIRDSWWPCQKVFYKIDGELQEGFCKGFDWKVGHGQNEQPIDESKACLQANGFHGSLWPETEEEAEGHA